MDVIRPKKRVKARKKHCCDACSKIISTGEYHDVTTYKSDGNIYNWRTCDRCRDYVSEALSNTNYSWPDGMSEQDFKNYMYEEHRDVAEMWWGL